MIGIEKEIENARLQVLLRIAILGVVSILLSFAKFNIPFLPEFLGIEFSVFPIYLCALLFGPISALVITIIKAFCHTAIFYVINGGVNYVGELSTLAYDLIFVGIAFFVFYKTMHHFSKQKRNGKKIKNRRIKASSLGGFSSAIATSIIMLPAYNYILIPLYQSYYARQNASYDFLAAYQAKLPSITAIWQGIIAFHLPWSMIKLICATLLTLIAFSIILYKKG